MGRTLCAGLMADGQDRRCPEPQASAEVHLEGLAPALHPPGSELPHPGPGHGLGCAAPGMSQLFWSPGCSRVT